MADPRLAPEQVAIEVHYQTQMPGLAWHRRLKAPVELLALGDMIFGRGYLVVARDDNPACRWCTELLLARACSFAPGLQQLSANMRAWSEAHQTHRHSMEGDPDTRRRWG
eukprot:7323280-Prymnesium_polylepis.2